MDQNVINVLVTGGGAPGIAGTIYALRNNSDRRPVRIITCDMNSDAVGKYMSDKFYVVPKATSPNFFEAIMNIAIQEKIDVVLPQVTNELPVLSSNIESFSSKGIKVAISSKNSIERANDKWTLLEVSKDCRVPAPKSLLTYSESSLIEAVKKFGYPNKKVIVKQRQSSGLRGLRVLSEDSWDVKRFLTEKPEPIELSLEQLLSILRRGSWPELIVQEYLPGEEYSVDVFRGNSGAIAIPRLRKKMRGGITFHAVVEMNEKMQEFSLKLAESLDLRFCFGFQFKLSDEGIPKILECNPRVQGTMVTSVFAGYNVIWWSIKEVLGEEVSIPEPIKNKVQFIRYWGGIAINDEGEVTGRI
jgi:carbamoyl-phosphate synthase large subunit